MGAVVCEGGAGYGEPGQGEHGQDDERYQDLLSLFW